MATNRYALADYIVTFSFPSSDNTVTTFSIGGPGQNGYEGSFMDSISITRNTDVWSTSADATGSWVHTMNLDRTGNISLTLNQISDDVLKLSYIVNSYAGDTVGINAMTRDYAKLLTSTEITVTNGYTNEVVAEGHDCYITKMPDLSFGSDAETREFFWTCGVVKILHNINNPFASTVTTENE